jgi:hypothetical protein
LTEISGGFVEGCGLIFDADFVKVKTMQPILQSANCENADSGDCRRPLISFDIETLVMS